MGDIEWAYLLLGFEGRINRAKFWLGLFVVWIGLWILTMLAVALNSTAVWWFVIALSMLAIWPSFALSIKRWHDRGKSGWWILIGLVPLIGGIWALVETGFLPGTPGTNEYGPDPLAGA